MNAGGNDPRILVIERSGRRIYRLLAEWERVHPEQPVEREWFDEFVGAWLLSTWLHIAGDDTASEISVMQMQEFAARLPADFRQFIATWSDHAGLWGSK